MARGRKTEEGRVDPDPGTELVSPTKSANVVPAIGSKCAMDGGPARAPTTTSEVVPGNNAMPSSALESVIAILMIALPATVGLAVTS